ncbi:MAG TPA: VOC family protein [Mobilitalea sp.]|nr:VOC family protein [Mobilitalea sp.]
METGIISHIAIAVKDIERTAKQYSELFGIKMPDIFEEGEETGCSLEYMGKQINCSYKIAFMRMGIMVLELIQPCSEENVWKDYLDQHGEGVHHLGFRIRDESNVEFMKEQGISLVQKTENKYGKNYYFDSKDELGVMIELCQKPGK